MSQIEIPALATTVSEHLFRSQIEMNCDQEIDKFREVLSAKLGDRMIPQEDGLRKGRNDRNPGFDLADLPTVARRAECDVGGVALNQ